MADREQADQVVFLASIAPILSGIKIGVDGMRLQLDVPESEMTNAITLLAWRDRVLSVSISPRREVWEDARS